MSSRFLTATLLLILSGCATNMVEERVITQFVEALDEKNEPALRRVVSDDFQHKALRSDDALRDLKMVRMPRGEVEILDVEETTEDSRRVTISDESGTKSQIELVREGDRNAWSVDDVIVRQKKKRRGSRTNAVRHTSEVMDLVFSVKEYLQLWADGKHEQIIPRSSPTLTAALQSVPPNWLPTLAAYVSENYHPSLARRPEATLDQDSAVVRLPARGGFLLVSVKRADSGWLIDDVEIHRQGDTGRPGSLRRQSDAICGVGQFLEAFAALDQPALQQACTATFYDSTMQFASHDLIQLPDLEAAPAELNIRAFSGRMTMTVPTAREFVRFDLVDPNYDADKQVARAKQVRRFLVDNVTLYDRQRRNERTLTSAFTAPARADLFLQALVDRNLVLLRQMSLRDFNDSVWNQMTQAQLQKLTIPTASVQGMKLTNSTVHGLRTVLTLDNDRGQQLQLKLYEQGGHLQVEDLSWPDDSGQRLSLRTQTELQLPVVRFADAWQQQHLDDLRQVTSAEFNRLVLGHFREFPASGMNDLAHRLDTAVRGTELSAERATVHMGLASQDVAVVHLVQERGRWLVNDVTVPQSQGSDRQLLSELRQLVVDQTLAHNERMRAMAEEDFQEQHHVQISPRQVISSAAAPAPVSNAVPLRPVPGPEIAPAAAIAEQNSKIVNADFEFFEAAAPADRAVPQEHLPSEIPQEFSPEPEVTPVPVTGAAAELPLKQVPASENTPLPGSGRYLMFGPTAGNTGKSLQNQPKQSSAAVDATLNLSLDPVEIN